MKNRYPHPNPGKGLEGRRFEEFDRAAKAGMHKRLKYHQGLPLPRWKPYFRRLGKEIRIIERLHLVGYFQMAADIVNWSKTADIPIGPGRGGLSASLVAYCLGITEIDPLQHGLVFERFINSDNNPFPAFQLDVSATHRSAIVDYLYAHYGRDQNIARIAAIRRRGLHDCIKTMGPRLNMADGTIAALIKSVPNRVADSEDPFEDLRTDVYTAPEKDRIIALGNLYRKIGKLPVGLEAHKTGFVIADKPLGDDIPVFSTPSGEKICHFPAEDVQKLGLARLFIIKLPALDRIHETTRRIRENRQPGFDINQIPTDDPHTYQLIQQQDTDGIFMMTTQGMKILASKIKPECLSDIAMLIALFRPKPLKSGLTGAVIRYRNPKILRYEDCEQIRTILTETHGVLLYQEQVIDICHELAGYLPEEGSGALQAILRGTDAEVESAQARFIVKATKKRVVSPEKAKIVFIGFLNKGPCLYHKAHAVAYAKIIYQMAYLKANYPDEFNQTKKTPKAPAEEKIRQNKSL